MNDTQETVYRRVVERDPGEFSLDGRMLGVLVEIDGRNSLAEVAERTGLTLEEVRKIVRRCEALRIVEPVRRRAESLDPGFLEALAKDLTLAVGPLSVVLIREVTESLGYMDTPLPARMAASIVERLAAEIRCERSRKRFQQSMVEQIMTRGYSE